MFWQEGTTSALDQRSIAASSDIGAVGVFNRMLNGRELTFSWNGEAFVDDQTGSSWNLLGVATSGELEGEQLEPVVHDNTLWFAWAAFKPETRIYLDAESGAMDQETGARGIFDSLKAFTASLWMTVRSSVSDLLERA